MARIPPQDRTDELMRIYRETVRPLYGFVSRRAGGARELAEDITQETYLRAVSAWKNGRQPANPLAWLQTVARNLLLNYFQRRPPPAAEAERIRALLDERHGSNADAAALVCWGMARVGPRQARLLEAFYIDGKSVRAIADDLGVSERAVEGRLRRARLALKQQLQPLVTSNGE